VHRWPRRLLVVVLAIVLLLDGAIVYKPKQVRSYLTHWKGSPTHTVAYGAYPVEGEPLLRFVAAGDVGDSGSRLVKTAEAIAELGAAVPYDALLLLGDNVYPRGDPKQLPASVFGPFRPVLDQGTELLAILGNHDVKDGNGPGQVKALGMAGRWWSKELGPVLLVGLDSNVPGNARQRAWLEATLRSSTAPWKVVALHHPPYSAGYQGSSLENRSAFTPLFERYGVQLVLSGHDHDYQRSEEIRGVTYIVSGAASGSRRTGSQWFTARSFSWHHFVELAVFGDELVVRAINQDARVADEAIIAR
jgi:3',5'-cyclic AMP phosphodiesterase CpdA